MKTAERLALAEVWSRHIAIARAREKDARDARRFAENFGKRLLTVKLPRTGLIVPEGVVMLDCSQHAAPSWRTIAEAYVSPDLIAEELAALPVVPRLVLVANQSS